MVHAENIDSGISNFQLDNRSGRDHHSLARLSKYTVSEAGAPARSRRPGLSARGGVRIAHTIRRLQSNENAAFILI